MLPDSASGTGRVGELELKITRGVWRRVGEIRDGKEHNIPALTGRLTWACLSGSTGAGEFGNGQRIGAVRAQNLQEKRPTALAPADRLT